MNTMHDDLAVDETNPAIDAVIEDAGQAGDAAELAEEIAATLHRLQRMLESGDTDLRAVLESDAIEAIDRLKTYAVNALILGGVA